jgi:predicted nucleic acid-binding protein
MNAVLVDTDVISYIFKDDQRSAPFINYLADKTLLYSFQTFAELRYWYIRHRWSEHRWKILLEYLEQYTRVEHSIPISDHWAYAMYSSQKAGRRMLAADAWIAATALELGIPLVTHNKKDFLGLDGLEIISFEED